MQHLGKISIYESHLRDLNREAEKISFETQLPRRPLPWRAILVTAVVLIGMTIWLIH